MPARTRPYEELSEWEKELDRWVKFKLWEQGHAVFNNGQAPYLSGGEELYPKGWKKPSIHETHFGCKVWFTDVQFGIGHSGSCETCYHEYPAVTFKWNCETRCTRGQRLMFQDEIRSYTNSGGFRLQDILAELATLR